MSYGTWGTVIEHADGRGVDDTASDALGDAHFVPNDRAAIIAAYRDAINAALPEGVLLCGDEFYGPFHDHGFAQAGYPITDTGRLDINAIICAIDFYEIAERIDSGADA